MPPGICPTTNTLEWASSIPLAPLFRMTSQHIKKRWPFWKAAYLALSGSWTGTMVVALWGLVSMFVVGNIIYTWLAGRRMRLHPVATLLAFLGGLTVFGVSGIILGPGIVAVTVASVGP